MLSLRILTAAALLPPLLVGLFLLSSEWIAVAVGVFVAAGAWEWAALTGLSVAGRAVYTVAIVALGLAAMWFDASTVTFALATIGWIAAIVELARFPEVHEGWLARKRGRLVAGFFVLVPAWVAVYALHSADPHSPNVLLFAMLLVWVADSLAYFAGHFFGRTKLAPAISPGKTIEGVVGGVIGVALLAAFGGTLVWHYRDAILLGWIALAIGVALFSVAGDLLESKLKRIAGVKDSGRLLPGHGGVLDRIDALTAALPIFALGWQLFFRDVLGMNQ